MQTLKALAAIASTDSHRPHIAGIHIEHKDGRAIGVATDGHILVALDLGAADAIAPQFVPTTALKPFKKGEADLSIAGVISCGGVRAEYDATDTYPNWRAILPREPASGEAAQFDASLLEKLRKFSVALGGKSLFRVYHAGGNPARAVLPISVPHYALVMPLRRIELDDSLPSWL